MRIEKGTKLRVFHARQGTFDAVATKSFDTETDEWFSVALDQDEPVLGANTIWERGDKIPTRRGSQVEIRMEASE